MRNIIQKSLIFGLGCLLTTFVWADSKVYDFTDASSLETDWTITKDVPSGGNGTCEVAAPGKFSEKSGSYLLFGFENKSKITITITSTASFSNISNITYDVIANDNSKPDFTLNIVDDGGSVVQNIYSNYGSKDKFGTTGTNKWGVSNSDINPSVSGHIQLTLYASSSGKYAAIDNMTVTYSGGGGATASTDATLKSIVYGSEETSLPGFAANKLEYNLVLPAGYVGMPPTVKGIPNDAKATVSYTLATTLSETSYIDVTAEDGKTKLRYSISFSVASDDPVAVTGVSLNKSTLTLEEGASETLTATVAPSNATDQSLTWSSNNTAVATVVNGVVNAVAEGTATITVKTNDGGLTADCAVTVTKKSAPVDPPAPSGEAYAFWRFSGNDTPATGSSESGTKMTVEFVTSDESKSYSSESAGYNAAVTDDMKSQGAKGVKMGANALYLKVTVDGGFKANDVVSVCGYNPWKVSSTVEHTGDIAASVATGTSKTDYNIGSFTLSADASALYMMRAEGSGTGICAIKVTHGGGTPTPSDPVAVTGVSLNKSTLSLEKGQSETLTATVAPSNATNKNITWASDNEAAATVNNGLVTAVAAGSANITVTTEDGSFTASCAVTVTEPDPAQTIHVTGVSLNKSTLSLEEGASETLTATITPSNATDKSLTWSSNNTAAATVVNGVVNAVAEGTATITVKTNDGGFTASCSVEVTEAETPSGPSTGYTTHAPEKYEEPKGYNTPLSQFNGREYEVYYVTRDPSGNNICIATNTDDKVAGISNGTATTVKARDNWFELKASGGKGGDGNAAAKDEFKLKSVQCIKMQGGQEMVFQVKGFDQFNFYGKDNNKDATKGKYFEVYIDDVLQAGNPGAPIDGYAIHRYDMSAAEHVIRLVGIGASDSKLTGFSLRVSDDPLVRHVGGPKTQTAYQTKDIERVAFRVRRAADYRLVWKNSKAIPGVTKTAGTNDSVFIEGIADAAAGVYTYTIEALNSAGEVKSAESGTITIQTQIFDAAYGNDFTTNIDEAITPLNFIYYAMNSADIKLNCDIEGLQLTFSKDSIATLTGTPTLNNTEGEHTYTISAAGGNTISGVITIIVPDPYFESFADAKTRDRMAISFSVIARHAANVTATGLPEGFIVSYDASSNKATISGTPNIGSGYPKTFDFTLNATPRYAGKNESSASGKLIVIDPNATAVLVVVKDRDQISEDPIALYLNQDPNLKCDITHRKQALLAGSSYDMFDLVLISEDVDADHEDVLKLTRGLAESGRVNKPILNMKSFSYSPDRLDWGEPDNGSLSKEGCFITVVRDDHPIFKDWKKAGDKIQVLDTVIAKGLMPINIYQQGTLCLATSLTRSIEDYYGDGEMQTILHEIPASLSGGYKYICLPIAKSSHSKLSADGKNLLKRIVQYLLSDQESVAVPTPEITKFTIDGVDGDINQIQRTITFDLDMSQHENLDLKNVVPQIELGGDLVQYAHVTPAQPSRGDTVDLSYSYIFPKEYIVSDYINRYIYEVTVNTYISDAIDHVYTAGDWVTVYDIFGRKLTVTNEDIYTMDLPRGVYVIVTESGQTLKITK